MTSPLAENLNNELQQSNPEVYDMLSDLVKKCSILKVFYLNLLMPKVLNITLRLVWQQMMKVNVC